MFSWLVERMKNIRHWIRGRRMLILMGVCGNVFIPPGRLHQLLKKVKEDQIPVVKGKSRFRGMLFV